MPAAAVIPAELGMGNFVAVKTFVVTIELYFATFSGECKDSFLIIRDQFRTINLQGEY